MPKPLEIYSAWEKEAPATICHLMQIDAGDGSAAKRLTLTDKPYVDKGVAGTRYHHTYPAPFHCIQSDIVTEESEDGTRYSSITITTFDGELLSALDSAFVQGRAFRMYRGDQRWSILEEDFPYRFVEIFRGVVAEAVNNGDGTITLSLRPAGFDLESSAASESSPLAFGICHNTSAYLVDSANLKYRCNSYLTNPTTDGLFKVFDNGVELVETTDFELLLEDEDLNEDVSGLFRGKFQLLASPSGTITTNQNYSENLSMEFGNPAWLLFRAIKHFYYPNYPTYQDKYEVFVSGEFEGLHQCFKADGTKLYILGVLNGFYYTRQFSLSTAWDITTISYDSKSLNSGSDPVRCVHIDAAGTSYYELMPDGVINQYTLSTAWDISTGTITGTVDLEVVLGVASNFYRCFAIVSNDVYVCVSRTIYKLSMTGGDISTLDDPVQQIILSNFARDITFSSDGKKFYFTEERYAPLVRQLNLPTAYDLTEAYYPKQSLMYEGYDYQMHLNAFGSIQLSDTDDKLLLLFYDGEDNNNGIYTGDPVNHIVSFDLTDGDLPADMLRMQYLNAGDSGEPKVGVFYRSEVSKRQVLTDICESFGASFSAARDGSLIVSVDWRTDVGGGADDRFFEIDLSAMIGERGQHIRQESTYVYPEELAVSYARNFNPISESESAGSLTDAQKLALATEKLTLVTENDYGLGTIVIDAYCAFEHDAQRVSDQYSPATERQYKTYDVDVSLWWAGAISSFEIGSYMKFTGDVRYPGISDPDFGITIGRKINWSKNMQTIRVYM
ncbi:MAG: hypothetical protein R3332_00470 [Pseudohongiellaceae bacterium]|nr:hypothetical protein [Pseudohongiellaceae bacterium]